MGYPSVPFSVVNTVRWAHIFNLTRDGEPWDIEGYDARMEMRQPASADAPSAIFSTRDGSLIVSGTSVALNVPRGVALGIPAGSYDYDIVLFQDEDDIDDAQIAFGGVVTVVQGVTR